MALPPRDQRHQYLRYEGLQYTDADIADFEARLARIYRREVHMVQVFDFRGLSDLMADGLSARMLMEHKVAQGVSMFTSRAWRRLFDIRGRWWSQETFEPEGLTVIAPALLVIDMAELGGQAIPAPVRAPQPPPPPPAAARTMLQRMARLEDDVCEICGALTEQGEVIDVMARDFSRFSTWTVTSLTRMMDRAGVTYTSYSKTPRKYQRSRVRRKTDEANTSIAQQDPHQPDP
ncbi:hypothetical protein Tco_0785544 [Tanacetum coccineum]